MPASQSNDAYRSEEVSSNKGSHHSEFITHMGLVPTVHFLV